MKKNTAIFFFTGILFLFFSCKKEQFIVDVFTNKEEIAENGYLYTPSTQSFLRGHHTLEKTNKLEVNITENMSADIDFKMSSQTDALYLSAKNVPIQYLVPRLHYRLETEPDNFDFFNLMMAEYSRNGLSFPFGHQGDDFTHFETNFKTEMPWNLNEDYDFLPNKNYRPIRISIINNCLYPGLWEISATDKTGELYHSWFNFPNQKYYDLTAKVNQIDPELIEKALAWKEGRTVIDLDRLRTVNKILKPQSVTIVDEEISYSSQGSRRKLSKRFVTYKGVNGYESPRMLSDILENPVKMSEFIPPGIYSIDKKKDFSFKEYSNPLSADVCIVTPKTSFDFENKARKNDELTYIEIKIDLEEGKKLILGNLPLQLLVQKEDFTLHGFGVGILSAGGFAERRKMLIEQGFCPSYAYLGQKEGNNLLALNSHNEGLEQIFIRSYPYAEKPYWDITLTSYERITDIVKYRVQIPPSLIAAQKSHSENYITPTYFSYRDDNLR